MNDSPNSPSQPLPTVPVFKVGDLLLNRYRILNEQPQSHHGIVFEAYDSLQNRPVAIKVLPEIPRRSPQLDRLFRRQIRSISRLEHPNISHLYALEEDEREHQLLVLELCQGTDLAEWLETGQPYSFTQVKNWVEQILQALAYAHSCGIIHRNLTPAHILIEPKTQRVKILDFGLSSLSNKIVPDPGLFEERDSLAFLAPEQRKNPQEATPQSDLYAVAALLWTLCCGQPPFDHQKTSPGEPLHVTATLPQFTPLPALRVPPQLFALLARNLREDPNQRSDSAASFRRELRACVSFSRQNSDALPLLPIIAEIEPATRSPLHSPNPFESCDNNKSIHQWDLMQIESHNIYGRDLLQSEMWSQVVHCCRFNQARILLLRGQVGVGKTRLANWLSQISSEHGWMTILRSDASNTSNQRPVRNAFCQALGLPPQCPEDPFSVLAQTLDPIDPQGKIDRSSLIDCLYSHVPRLARHRLVLLSVLKALASHHSLLWLMDDLDQSQPEELACIAFLIRKVCQEPTPITFLITVDDSPGSNFALGPINPVLQRNPDHVWERSIPPLPPEAMLPLIQELAPLDPLLCRQIAQSSMGNPLYAHHAIAFLSETHRLKQESGVIRYRETEAPLPQPLEGLILARLAACPHEKLLIALSAVGLNFTSQMAQAVADRLKIEQIGPTLDDLITLGFLIDIDNDLYRFAHNAVFAALQRKLQASPESRPLHLQAAELISRVEPPMHPSEFMHQAHHYLLAGEPQTATTLLLRGLAMAHDCGAYYLCERLFEVALQWLSFVPQSLHRNETELQCRLAQTRLALQNNDVLLAEARLRAAQNLVDPLDPPTDLLCLQAEMALRMGRITQTADIANRLLQGAEATGDIMVQAQAHYCLGSVALRMLDPKEARAQLEQAIQLDPRACDFDALFSTYSGLTREDHLVRSRRAYIQAALQAKRDELALQNAQELLQCALKGFDDALIAETYEFIAGIYQKCQQMPKAIEAMGLAAQYFDALGFPRDAARCLGQLGYYHLRNQNLDDAELAYLKYSNLTLELCDSAISFSHLNAGWLAEMHNDLQSANEFYLRTYEIPLLTQFPEYQGMISARLARVNDLLGHRQTSDRRMRQAFSIDAHHPINVPHWASLLEEAAHVAEASGEPKHAVKFLRRALHCWLSLGLNDQANRCRETLDRLSQQQIERSHP